MASILCKANGVRHTHASADDVRACQGVGRPTVAAPRPTPAPSTGRQVVRVNDDPTERQLWKVKHEGGDDVYAAKLTRLGCSQYIQQLIADKTRRPIVNVPAAQPRAPQPATSFPPQLLNMLKAVKPGRYAWRASTDEKFTFVRISVPKNGRLAGCVKIQTQHGENLKDRMTVYPSGNVWLEPRNRFIEPILIGIIVDSTTAAITYATIKRQCCKCGTKLTDPRSRWYRIGPDCEEMWPHIIEQVIDQYGEWDGTDREPELPASMR
jgi:hypothetical protein